jgi:hypothetical protein
LGGGPWVSLRWPLSFRVGIDVDIARVIERAQAEGLWLTGEDGLLPWRIEQAVEAAGQVELTDHLGYGPHAAEGCGSGNSRTARPARRCKPWSDRIGVPYPLA